VKTDKSIILFIKHANSSFVLTDQKILEQNYQVIPFLLDQPKGGLIFLWRLVVMCWFVFLHSHHTSVIVTWFGDYHSAFLTFLARLLKIKMVIFIGGQETCCYPELKKGVYRNFLRGNFVKFALRNCSLIILNHSSLMFHENYYYHPEGKKDGLRHYIPNLKTNFEIINNGIDTRKFFRAPYIPKNGKQVLTVGTTSSIYDFYNKGFDLFVQLAERNPHLLFTIIGIKDHYISLVEEKYKISKINNLNIIPSYCPNEVLFENYNRAKVFIQASITEGMPNTLNEAMLCGCIPVGSNVNGIPDAIGNTGVIVTSRNVEALEAGLYKALSMNTEIDAIKHAMTYYSLESRKIRTQEIFRRLVY
jgi:glycosyltransferase involved in cell wall biosynthesis